MDIREIARRAKVSTATVSRAINHVPTVDPQLAKRVWMAVEDRALRTWERTVKYYDSLRVVYEIQTRLREWGDQAEADRAARTNVKKTDTGTKSPNESGGSR